MNEPNFDGYDPSDGYDLERWEDDGGETFADWPDLDQDQEESPAWWEIEEPAH